MTHGNLRRIIDEFFNFAVKQEKRVDNISKKLLATNSISEETRRSLNQLG